MHRRGFLKKGGTIALGACAAGMAKPARLLAEASRPNILLIMTDQQTAGALSCAGNTDLSTPAMDSIAAHGVRFGKAYCTQPLCIPSRTSLFTGRMPHRTGAWVNDYDNYVGNLTMMGTVFTSAGYDTGYIGKWHLPVANTPGGEHGFSTVLHAKDNGIDSVVPQACVDFIQQDRTGPFLLVASFVNPHDICEWARGDALRNGPIPAPPPPEACPALPANFGISADEPEIVRHVQTLAPGTYPTVDWEENKWRQYRWAYNRLTEMVDARIGVVLQALRDAGRENDTLIVFTSDHGDGNAAHHWNQKQILFDETARIPFIVSYKGVTRSGAVDDTHLVSNGLDLIPTLCDYAGIPVPAGLTGKSVRPLAEGAAVSAWRDHVITETEFCPWQGTYDITGRMVRTDRYKYIAYSAGVIREAIYDMRNDPGETVNLAMLPDHAGLLEEHRQILRTWCTSVNDTFMVPAGTGITPPEHGQGPFPSDTRVEYRNAGLNVRFRTTEAERVRIRLYDISGRTVYERKPALYGRGAHAVRIPVQSVPDTTIMWEVIIGTQRTAGTVQLV